jgi:uncharacterized phosphosugar-binding protein
VSAAEYLTAARDAVDRVSAQEDGLRASGELIATALGAGHRVIAFGTGHSHLLAEELKGRAGGLGAVEAVLEPALMLDERLLVEHEGVGAGDVVIVASNSGRNAVPVEFAEESGARGASVIAVTSRAHSAAFTSRAPSGKRLMEVADVVLDNGSPAGDALVTLRGRDERVGAISTVTGALLLQAAIAEAAQLLAERGQDPGVLVSFNVDASHARS